MKQHTIYLIFLLTTPLLSWAQSISPHTLSSANASTVGSSAMLSWTVGQTVSYSAGDDNVLISGIHQPIPSQVMEVLEVINSAHTTIEVYPNPTVDFVQIKEGNNEVTSVSIYSLDGRERYEFDDWKSNLEGRIDFTEMAVGVYVLIVRTDQHIYEHKIIKK
ncbi:T9SS type A sorting domain-containing protein [Reichenbachiella agariperforans]|uniref:Por secretion system C-terminal sorting domain-containing protein n=1 Tax=Reichenbachiella agariperforans TaxID=156994 RepID=A0A1M6LIE6_REIAG|nr:T9SS type A sorting domain-containing protein [Reichenbachiella agariperforans]MBU2913935.1 T9SS type A sorting domain-containing protein [Reichenbachiella agariperforans]SHJ70941.1 Por secretion system C-terminal sorting domain-containing protein [Reichenbachiella agariperforans]